MGWKILAAALFICFMTALRYVMAWSIEGASTGFVWGVVVGAGTVIAGYFVFNWLERKGWAD